jgi:predicted transcriptional regulator
MTKRGKLEIMRDILQLIQDNGSGIKPTPLLRKSKLSSVSFKEYYSELLDRKFVREMPEKDGSKQIILTEKGFRFLNEYMAIINFIDEFEL